MAVGCDLAGLCLTLGRTSSPRGSSAALEEVSLVWKNENSLQLFRHGHSSLRQVLTTVSWVGNQTKWPCKLPSARFFRLGKGNNVMWLMPLKSATRGMSGLISLLYIEINRNHWCKLPSDKFKTEIEMILLWHSQHAELVATGHNTHSKFHLKRAPPLNECFSAYRILCTILSSFLLPRLGLSLKTYKKKKEVLKLWLY